MPVIIVESEWKQTEHKCPLCGWPLYSDSKEIGCPTPQCEFKTTSIEEYEKQLEDNAQ